MNMARMYRRSGGLAALVAAALALAACSSAPTSPQVASLGKNNGTGSSGSPATGTSAASLSKGNPTRLVDEWAACERRHGDRNQADPG